MPESESLTPQKPTSKSYPEWLGAKSADRHISLERARYEAVVNKIALDVADSRFWSELLHDLQEIDDMYYVATGYKLFASPPEPVLLRKSWESFLLKSFRNNIVDNENWPLEPQSGWLIPENWFTRIHDMVRTMFVVKYLDGVSFLTDALRTRAELNGHGFRADFEAKDEGYYAAHAYVTVDVDVPTAKWDTEATKVEIELQVTTQLQEVIRKLTHSRYEQRRGQGSKAAVPWQWDYASDEFTPNYLGHILHYVEGMIMEVRNRDGGNNAG